MQTSFQGYIRENGRVGVRNHVIVLPVDDLSNAAAEAVSNNIKGALAIPHPYGRLQFGADLELHFRTLIGTGANPNVAAVVVIGIEDQWTKRVVDGIAATGKPVTGFGIELHGDHDTIMRASKVAKQYVQWASEKPREECALAELWVSTKCGESDTTTGLASTIAWPIIAFSIMVACSSTPGVRSFEVSRNGVAKASCDAPASGLARTSRPMSTIWSAKKFGGMLGSRLSTWK